MKSFLLSILVLAILISTNTYSQDIKAKLNGHLSMHGFTVVDDEDNVLFRVTGDGNVGIGNATPLGLFDTRRTISTGLGRSIFIQGESINNAEATGDAIIAGGDNISNSSNGGKITLKGGATVPMHGGDVIVKAGDNLINNGGNVKIEGGNTSTGYGGNIDVYAGLGDPSSGNINLTTAGYYHFGGGDINLTTGEGPWGDFGGNITLKTTGKSDPDGSKYPGHINLICGESDDRGGSNINIIAGNEITYGKGGDINLTPGIGATENGLVVVNGSGTYSGTWTQASDERYKKNINTIQNAVDRIKQLDGVSYEFKSDEFPEKNFSDGRQIGLIAQDVEKVFPELVKTDSEGYQSVAYQNMVAVLIEAVKEQQSAIDNLKKEIEELKYSQRTNVSLTTTTAE